MKQRQISQNSIDKEVKKGLLVSASEKFLLTESDLLKNKRTELLQSIIEFYQNEYVPVLSKHTDIMAEWNQINMELFSRGIISKEDVMNTNELLKNKLEKLF